MRFKMSFKLAFKYEVSSWCIVALSFNAIWAQIGSNIPLGRLLLGALDRLGMRFSHKNGTKMASKSAKSLILCQDCSKTEKIEPRLARKFLLGASRAALGRCLGPAWKHLGSILGAFWSDFYAEMEQRWHLTPISPSSYVKTARELKTTIFLI